MYEINYIDWQFFIITKPQDKSSLNWPVGSGHLSLGLQIYFFIISEKAERIDYGDGRRVGGGGGYANKMGYIYIDIINQYHAHGLSSFIARLISFV